MLAYSINSRHDYILREETYKPSLLHVLSEFKTNPVTGSRKTLLDINGFYFVAGIFCQKGKCLSSNQCQVLQLNPKLSYELRVVFLRITTRIAGVKKNYI